MQSEFVACECCPHILVEDLQRDKLLRDVWDLCPDSGCLYQLCERCVKTPLPAAFVTET